jgi:hypothetical protein
MVTASVTVLLDKTTTQTTWQIYEIWISVLCGEFLICYDMYKCTLPVQDKEFKEMWDFYSSM